MSDSVSPIPPGQHTLTASLNFKDAKAAAAFYEKAFNAVLLYDICAEDGTVYHAEMKIGDSTLLFSAEMPEQHAPSAETAGSCPTLLRIYTEDCDQLFQQAVDAGAEVITPPETQFWGDRVGSLRDPFGYRWNIATHVEDVSPEEIMRRAAQIPECEE